MNGGQNKAYDRSSNNSSAASGSALSDVDEKDSDDLN